MLSYMNNISSSHGADNDDAGWVFPSASLLEQGCESISQSVIRRYAVQLKL
jgi:hypothetical protein